MMVEDQSKTRKEACGRKKGSGCSAHQYYLLTYRKLVVVFFHYSAPKWNINSQCTL